MKGLSFFHLIFRLFYQENFDIDDFILSKNDMNSIQELDTKESLILQIQSLEEVHRLKNIQFVQ